jgi:light-regulated signal transduction histidine kinase (bacteriophytochrome)
MMPPPTQRKRKTSLAALTEERDALARAKLELETRLSEAEALVAEQARQARAVAEEFQQFIYSASHDLQEPIRSVTSYAQLLERLLPPASEAAEFSRYIQEGSARINALMRDLLSFSRLSDSPRRTAVSVAAVVNGASFFLQKQLQDAGATITADELPEVSADENQLSQLFVELLQNAVKFRSEAPLEIRVSAEEQEGENLISVSDNGQGIDPKYHEHVFGVFKRLHGREVEGTGIGLALCRKIVNAHGGRIWVESLGAGGSTFRFTLPV